MLLRCGAMLKVCAHMYGWIVSRSVLQGSWLKLQQQMSGPGRSALIWTRTLVQSDQVMGSHLGRAWGLGLTLALAVVHASSVEVKP